MKKLFFIFSFVFISIFNLFSQSSEAQYIHEILTKNPNCKTGALSDNWGFVVLSSTNGIAWAHIPVTMKDYMNNELDSGRVIDDVCLTERGNWFCVGEKLYGEGYPQSMWDKIIDLLNQGDRINCVTFNDYGEWMIITDNHYSASDNTILEIMKEVSNKHGYLHSASMNNQGLLIVGANGFQSRGVIPDSLDKYLRWEQTFPIKYIKFTEKGSWLVTDGISKYWYNLN